MDLFSFLNSFFGHFFYFLFCTIYFCYQVSVLFTLSVTYQGYYLQAALTFVYIIYLVFCAIQLVFSSHIILFAGKMKCIVSVRSNSILYRQLLYVLGMFHCHSDKKSQICWPQICWLFFIFLYCSYWHNMQENLKDQLKLIWFDSFDRFFYLISFRIKNSLT